jgi:hypothetical protein
MSKNIYQSGSNERYTVEDLKVESIVSVFLVLIDSNSANTSSAFLRCTVSFESSLANSFSSSDDSGFLS